MDLSGLWRRGQHGRLQAGEPDDELQHQVSAAHREWVTAQQYFQSVSEPELVDHAVHSIIAAEQKYTYLLRKLREHQGHIGDQG
ncbi:MAG TPA: DUF2508 family protein [Symbiobacteriaceae bacterium]|nr:DUF2508 family protein [Symbiobacteriaceae bacterium]